MATNLPSYFSIEFLEQLLKCLVNFTLLKYVKSQRSYSFLITKELIFGFQNLDLKDHFSASLNTNIVISTGDLQIRWNVLSLWFKERESGKWPLGLSDFYITILPVMIIFSTLDRYPFATPNENNFLCSNVTFFVGF